MTLADLDRMEAALAKRLLPWIDRASSAIIVAVEDAQAHGEKAVTDTLRGTEDGRSSARRITRSPSYLAAVRRLNDLQAALIGPSVDSLEGLIRDARAAFYADSIALWTPHIDIEFRVTPELAPTEAGERLMRGAIVHGYDLSREIGPAIQQTKDHLFVALNKLGRRNTPGEAVGPLMKLWADMSRDRLIRKVSQVLSDSDKAAHEATGWLLIKPEYRGERTLETGGIHF